ncbi:MAG: hypothetical protein FJ297_06895 [Planctomycetes bacterium]|nr:hypothetical protein [Planctomycetota bacterium]
MEARTSKPESRTLERVLRAGSVVLVLAVVICAGIETARRVAARRQLEQAERAVRMLLEAPPEELPGAIQAIEQHWEWTAPLLETIRDREGNTARRQLSIDLARYRLQEDVADFIDRLLNCSSAQLVHYAAVLSAPRGDVTDRLWSVAEDAGLRAVVLARLGKSAEAQADLESLRQRSTNDIATVAYYTALATAYLGQESAALADLESALESADEGLLYNASCAYSLLAGHVASTDPDRARKYADRAVTLLDQSLATGFRDFRNIDSDPDLDPIRSHPNFHDGLDRLHWRWCFPFASIVRDDWETAMAEGGTPEEHLGACQRLAEQGFRPLSLSVASSDVDEAMRGVSAWYRPRAAEQEVRSWAGREAVMLALSESPSTDVDRRNDALRGRSDPDLRSGLIHFAARLGPSPDSWIDRLGSESDPAIRAAIVQLLGEFSIEQLPAPRREALVPGLLDLYRGDPDREVHGSVRWLLGQWGRRDRLDAVDAELAAAGRPEGRQWYVNGQGVTMVVLPSPAECLCGSPVTEEGRQDDESVQRLRVETPFSLSANEVTVGQFERFLQDQPAFRPQFAPSNESDKSAAQTGVSWYAAAAFCNWLSRQEGIPENQWCYQPNDSGQFDDGMKVAPGFQRRRGYRLPTEVEWEYACRAATDTAFSFGHGTDWLPNYGWFKQNSGLRVQLVGMLKPNRWGLFDMHGNVAEWCHDGYRTNIAGRSNETLADNAAIADGSGRVLRGGSFLNLSRFVRCASRQSAPPGSRHAIHGFRIARTEPNERGTTVASAENTGEATGGAAAAARGPVLPAWRLPPGSPLPALAPFDARQVKQYQQAWASHLAVPIEFTNSVGMQVGIPLGHGA